MTTRTVQFLGLAYGAEPCSVTVTANGNTIFSGTVTTQNAAVPAMPDFSLIPTEIPLFNLEIDKEFTGQVPMTCVVNNGTVIFGDVWANYVSVNNPVYSQAQIDTLTSSATPWSDKVQIYSATANPPFSTEELNLLNNPSTPPDDKNAILTAHNATPTISSGPSGYGILDSQDSRANVTIDGVPQSPVRNDLTGEWWWQIAGGSTLAYSLLIDNPGT